MKRLDVLEGEPDVGIYRCTWAKTLADAQVARATEALVGSLVAHGYPVREVRAAGGTLEDVFRDLTRAAHRGRRRAERRGRGVRSFWPLFKRELFAFFVTPLAWVLIAVFLLVQGMHFYLLVDHFSNQAEIMSDQTPVQAFFGNTVLLYLVLFLLIPAMTMRLFAEERRSGTIETLMTAPVSSGAVVLAKYASALTTYVAMWAPTVLYLLILARTGDLDWHVVASSYLGVLLVGAAYLSLGLLASAVTTSQFLALVMTALVVLGLFILGIAEFVTPEGTVLHDVCSYVSVWAQMNDFASGIVDLRHVAFNATLIVLPLFITTRAVDAWRWG